MLGKDFTLERAPILIGVLLGVLVLALLGMQYSKASSVPPIHNISTDTEPAAIRKDSGDPHSRESQSIE